MRVLTTLSLSSPPSPHTPKSLIPSHLGRNSIIWAKKALVGALGGALSVGLLVSSPSSIAIESSPVSVQVQPPSSEYCREDEGEVIAESGPEPVATNEGIVEEAWEIVNDSFLDTGRPSWSPENWQVRR